MIEALAGPGAGEVDDLTASDLLALARERKAVEEQAAADLLEVAARWADLHPPESIHDAASFTVPGCEHEEPIAGEGAPLVAEFCVAELGTVLGISTTAAKKLIGHALELRHRLPRLWEQVHAGQVPAWRARAVAEATIHAAPSLTREAAGFVDSQVAAVAGRIGQAQLDRLLAETIRRYDLATADPTKDPEEGWQHVDPRHVTVDKDDVHYAGTLHLEADLDLADALDLDRAVAHHAAVQKALGSQLPLNARRAKALGDLARTQTALDLHAQDDSAQNGSGFEARGAHPQEPRDEAPRTARTSTTDEASTSPTEDDKPDLPAAREVVIHAHFDATLSGEQTVFGPTGRMENGQRLILLDQIRSWCADSRTKVTIKPVIDLNTQLTAQGYDIPDRIREQVILRDRTCVFPRCTRPARGCDIDHIVEYDHADTEGRPQPGPTQTDNLACLCRFHHRLKTHSPWNYRMTEPGVFEWTSPHGHHYRRDHTGTTALDPPEPPGIPRPRRR
ncbi:HNH endonuclease signature motif containing protein [Nocardioides ganghwensis]|uniref:HNH endonuclease n=1 Tax=Nocardioides ganghwensis TaxID=252230 RepID=A0A4Q2SCT4_9ACTN|nr:HNH endonuclease signature motif containing protein [Nocardioides ganghwensis]RYC02243.1 HNH endonuclease [Nocardioides ganghwensis]